MSKVKPILYMLRKGGISVLQTSIFLNHTFELIIIILSSLSIERNYLSIYIIL